MTKQDPGQLTRNALKNAVRKIVLAQGNNFIKELLRKNNIAIGSTKADFERNLMQAIAEGKLTQGMVEEWLAEVEGWGNQHIYLFRPPEIARTDVARLLTGSKHKKLVGQPVSYGFPTALALSAITVTPDHLSMSWHRSKSGWERAKAKDYQQEEGTERYEYRAFRERFDRSVVRFEWRFADPFCAIMVQLPHEGDEHEAAMARVWEDLKIAGIASAPLERIRLSPAFKALSRRSDGAVVQSARMMTEGGHVDLVSTLSEGGIADVEAVRQVRRAVDDEKFAAADGMFDFRKERYEQLSRAVKVQGYGMESRIRIWVQCRREDVYLVMDIIWKNNAEQ
jgi:hypothetical protein